MVDSARLDARLTALGERWRLSIRPCRTLANSGLTPTGYIDYVPCGAAGVVLPSTGDGDAPGY